MKRPRIFCVGCSFTSGVPDTNFASWTSSFANLLPEYEVYNLGIPGTSINFHSWLIKSIPRLPGDIIIHQVTTQGRLTSWEKFDVIERSIISNNIKKLSDAVIDKIKTITYATPFEKTSADTKLASLYFNYLSDTAILTQFENDLKSTEGIADYTYYHLNPIPGTDNKIIEYDSFLKTLGNDNFKELEGDNYKHLNKKGCDRLAEWVYTNMKSKGIL